MSKRIVISILTVLVLANSVLLGIVFYPIVSKTAPKSKVLAVVITPSPPPTPTSNPKTDIFVLVKKPTELRQYLQAKGASVVMQELIDASGGGSVRDCHQESHFIGRTVYQIWGPDTFKTQDFSCHSGFVHGAMEEFLVTEGTIDLPTKIDKICGQFKTSFANFECLHGVGHGLLAYEDYNLPETLKLCKQLSSPYTQSACYGGAFMENIVAAEGNGAKVDHETKWVNNDPQFPCNSIDKNYPVQEQCYLIQTSRMLDIFNHNFDKIIPECNKAPINMRSTCYRSLGRDAAGQTLRDPLKIRAICQKVAPTHLQDCLLGALNVIVDFWGENLADQALRYCEILDNNKTWCLQRLNSRLKEVCPLATLPQNQQMCKN